MFPFDLRPSLRTNIIFFSGKADKTNNNEFFKALVKTIPVTSRGFLKCKGTYFLTLVGICKHCNVW